MKTEEEKAFAKATRLAKKYKKRKATGDEVRNAVERWRRLENEARAKRVVLWKKGGVES